MREDEELLWRWRLFGQCDVHECTILILYLRISIALGGASAANTRLGYQMNQILLLQTGLKLVINTDYIVKIIMFLSSLTLTS